MGACAYDLVVDFFAHEKFADASNCCALEIGSERGEGSTFFLHQFFARRGVPFYSVDFEKSAYQQAHAICSGGAYLMSGEEFLAEVFPSFGRRVIFAYLDNFDWIYKSWGKKTADKIISRQAPSYRRQGMTLSNQNSMKAHLAQSKLLCHHASPECIVLCDDTWPLPDSGYSGKGGLAVPYLLGEGFRVLAQSAPATQTFHGYVALKKG